MMPQGTPPAGGGTMPQGTSPGGSGMTPPGGEMVPPPLIDALIQYLAETSGDPSAAATAAAGLQNGGEPGGPPPASSGEYTITAVYSQNGGSETQTGQTYTASNTDESAIYVYNSGILALANASIT